MFFNLVQDMGVPMSEEDVAQHDPTLGKPKRKAKNISFKDPNHGIRFYPDLYVLAQLMWDLLSNHRIDFPQLPKGGSNKSTYLHDNDNNITEIFKYVLWAHKGDRTTYDQTKHFITKIALQALCQCTFCTILRPGFLSIGGWTRLLLSFVLSGDQVNTSSNVTVMWPDQIQNPSSGGIWTWDLTQSHSHANRLTTAPPIYFGVRLFSRSVVYKQEITISDVS